MEQPSYKYCRRGHLLTPDNVIQQRINSPTHKGKVYETCKICRAEARALNKKPLVKLPTRPSQIMWTDSEKQFYADLEWMRDRLIRTALTNRSVRDAAVFREEVRERYRRMRNLFSTQGFQRYVDGGD